MPISAFNQQIFHTGILISDIPCVNSHPLKWSANVSQRKATSFTNSTRRRSPMTAGLLTKFVPVEGFLAVIRTKKVQSMFASSRMSARQAPVTTLPIGGLSAAINIAYCASAAIRAVEKSTFERLSEEQN
jgi:hypothetical protein